MSYFSDSVMKSRIKIRCENASKKNWNECLKFHRVRWYIARVLRSAVPVSGCDKRATWKLSEEGQGEDL